MSSRDRAHRAQVPPFKRNSITEFRRKLSAFLMGQKASHKVLTDQRPVGAGAALQKSREDWDDRNDIASSYLAESCSDPENAGALTIVLNGLGQNPPLTCAKIFEQLETEYNNRDVMFIIAAQRTMSNLSFIPNEKGESFITRLLEHKQVLVNLGKEVDNDTDCFGILLNAMDREIRFKHLTAAIRSANDINWEKAKRIVINSEATPTEEKTPIEKSNYAGAGQSKPDCQICGGSDGHSAKNCHFRFTKNDDKDKRKGGGKGNNKNKNDKTNKPTKDLSRIKCFKCQAMGHYSDKCPQNKDKPGKDKANKGAAWDSEERSGMMREGQEG